MLRSTDKLIALFLSVLLMLLPLQSSQAGLSDTFSGSGITDEMMVKTDSYTLGSDTIPMSEDCQHCKTGDCDISSICYTSTCFTATAAILPSSGTSDTGKSITYPAGNKHLKSVIQTSLFRPPRY